MTSRLPFLFCLVLAANASHEICEGGPAIAHDEASLLQTRQKLQVVAGIRVGSEAEEELEAVTAFPNFINEGKHLVSQFTSQVQHWWSPSSGGDKEAKGQNCVQWWCELSKIETSAAALPPGNQSFPSGLRGIFWLDGHDLTPARQISFHSFKGGLRRDGKYFIEGPLFGEQVLGIDPSAGLAGFIGVNKASLFYKVLASAEMYLSLECTMKNGDLDSCVGFPTVGRHFGAPFASITLKRTEKAPPNFAVSVQALGFTHTFTMRQIFTETGSKTSQWWRYMTKMALTSLATPKPTSKRRLAADIKEKVLETVMDFGKAFQRNLISGVQTVVHDYTVEAFNPNVPTYDVYEYKIDFLRPNDAMCPHRTWGSYLDAAYQVAGNHESGARATLSKSLASFSEVQHILRATLWSYAQEQTGKPVNPATSAFLHGKGPNMFITWDKISDLMLFLIELPAFVLGSGSSRLEAFLSYAKVSCFEPSALGYGPMLFNWTKVSSDVQDLHQDRGYYTATLPQASYMFNPDAAIFLPTGQPQHTQLRSLFTTIGWASTHRVPFQAISSAPTRSLDKVIEKEVGALMLPSILETLFGEAPPHSVLAAAAPYMTLGRLGIFGQKMKTYMLGPLGLTRQIIKARVAVRKWAMTTRYGKWMVNNSDVQNFMRQFPGTARDGTTLEEHFMQNMVDTSLFAGALGTTDLATKCVTLQRNDPKMQALFEENPETFIIETMRLDPAVTSFTPLLKEDTEVFMEGRKILLAKGTPYQSVIATANLDQTHWIDTETFMPNRSDLGDTLSWNGLARDVEAKDLSKAPRGCPGYCASIKLGAAVCAKMVGSLDRLLQDGKINDKLECNNFGDQDCLGEWSEWGECSRSCGFGSKARTFQITRPARGKGRACAWEDGSVQRYPCNKPKCPELCYKEVNGKCAEYSWRGLAEDPKMCDGTMNTLFEVFIELAGAIHFRDFPLTNAMVKSLDKVIPSDWQFANLQTKLLQGPPGSPTYDLQSFDAFTNSMMFSIVSFGLRMYFKTEAPEDIAIPTRMETLPLVRVGPAMIQLDDIDTEPNLQTKATVCLFWNWSSFVFRDDLDVDMRNNYDQVMRLSKYYTPIVEQILGRRFKRKMDYIYQLYARDNNMSGGEVFPVQWDFAKLFLENYEEIYAEPVIPGQYFQGPTLWMDAAEKFLAFGHIGQFLVEVLDQPIGFGGETAVYAIKTAGVRGVHVREGFDQVGADMYFSREGLPLAVGDGANVFWKSMLSSEAWQYWKFSWRSSLVAVVTLRNHLLYTHNFMSTLLGLAARDALPPMHPMRRLMTRFTYGTHAVNFGALFSLIGSGALANRIWPFADHLGALTTLWDTLPNVYEHFNQVRSPETELPEGYPMLSEAPYYTNGTKVYRLLSDYLGDFIELYQDDWCSGGKMTDAPLAEFTDRMKTLATELGRGGLFDIPAKLPPGARKFKCDWLTEFHQMMNGVLFGVTAYHAQVGTVSAMYIDPEFATNAWMPDGLTKPKQDVLSSTLAASTSQTMPKLIGNYSHLCNGIRQQQGCATIFNSYQQKFEALSAQIKKANEGNPYMYIQMDPGFIETSVAK